MKSRALLIGLCILGLCSPRILSAQENWRIGIEATPSYFMMYNKTDWADNFHNPAQPELFDVKGFSGGIRLTVDFTEYMFMSSGFRYVSSRQDYVQFSQNEVYSQYENYIKTSEMQLPLMACFGTSNRDDFRFYAGLGLGFNYRLGYEERRAFTTKEGPLGVYSIEHNYEANTYSVVRSIEGSVSGDVEIDKMYKDFTLFGLFETGITSTFSSGLGINVALQFQYGITNPENRAAQYYDIPDGMVVSRLWHTETGVKWSSEYVELDVRPTTHPIHIGILLGVYYQFGY